MFTEHETLRKTPPCFKIFRSVTLLLKATASTSSIYDEKLFTELDLYSFLNSDTVGGNRYNL